MDFVKDVQALGLLLTLQLAGFLAWLVAALPPILAILPIPHSPHEWGLTLASGGLYLLGRRRDHKRQRARRAAAAHPPAVAPAEPKPKPTKKENAKHSLRKISKP